MLFENDFDCCGCSACYNVCPHNAITMEPDEKGFLYPLINNDKCIECGLCKKVCAFQGETKAEQKPLVYAVKAADDVRLKSTSGGAFTVLSDIVLENGGVVYGVKFDENLKAVHTRAEDKKERDLCRNSKYSQSDMGNTMRLIKKDLEEGKKVLFTGTPCQTDAVKNFIPENKRGNLLLVEILCHGVLSPKLFSEYISFIEKKRKKKVVAYSHRGKDLGWGHDEKAIFSDKSEEKNTALLEIWKKIFYTDASLRPSCYKCKYTRTPRCSDITIADFWGIDIINPEFYDNRGVSLIIVNSDKGKELFETVKDKFMVSEQSLEDAKVRNINLYTPTKPQKSVSEFWGNYQKDGFEYIADIYGEYNLKARIKRRIKKILGK